MLNKNADVRLTGAMKNGRKRHAAGKALGRIASVTLHAVSHEKGDGHRRHWPLNSQPMLMALNALQLVLYIALLALTGQGLLALLVGAHRDRNVFFKLLQVLTRPFTEMVRLISPRQVADKHVPLATFLLLVVLYVAVTFEKVSHCLQLHMAGCR